MHEKPHEPPSDSALMVSQKAILLQQYLDFYNSQAVQHPERRTSVSSNDSQSSDADSANLSPANMNTLHSIHSTFTPHRNLCNSRSSNVTYASNSQRRGSSRSSSIAPIPEDHVLESPADFAIDDGRQSYDEQMNLKSTLTDLLNCDTVRHDERMRAWVQSRLMEAEHELKRHRRRRTGRSVSVCSETSVSGNEDVTL